MDIEKLIEQLKKSADFEDYPVVASFAAIIEKKYLRDAATALSTLQAENEKLRAELEQVKREKDAAVSDLEYVISLGGNMNTCQLCGNAQCHKRGGVKSCLPKWRGIQKDSSPYLVEDEVTEFTKKQWDWLLRRFTKKEDWHGTAD